jgi:hypothetical protein
VDAAEEDAGKLIALALDGLQDVFSPERELTLVTNSGTVFGRCLRTKLN